MPVKSKSNYFDTHIPSHGQYTAEFELRYAPFGKPGKVQLFGWLSHGNIGSYSDALAEPVTTPNYPDVTLTRGHDRFNYGFVLSAEQAITDDLGMFSRASWSPERVESMGWTDCGESFSLGAALKGTRWRRPDDTLGLAGVIEGLSPIARRYFAAGGMGILIGDGKLNYKPETVFETYYAFSPVKWAAVTPRLPARLQPRLQRRSRASVDLRHPDSCGLLTRRPAHRMLSIRVPALSLRWRSRWRRRRTVLFPWPSESPAPGSGRRLPRQSRRPR